MNLSYSLTTGDIHISVQPFYLSSESMPDEKHYIWAYRVQIANRGKEKVKLISRYWNIMDGNGGTQEVRGKGVVGEQPVIRAGEAFEYTSGTHLPTPSGIMRGEYTMETEGGKKFTVDIPAFSLDSPDQQARAN